MIGNNMIDDGFIHWLCNPDDDVGYMENELKHDNRKNNTVGDLPFWYNDFVKYRNSELAGFVDRAVDLVPGGFEVAVKDVRQVMKKYYNLDDKMCDRVVREVGSNDKRIQARRHIFDPSIDEIRLQRT